MLDFGVARVTESDFEMITRHTDLGQLVGTIPYMSPEQVSGDPAELGVEPRPQSEVRAVNEPIEMAFEPIEHDGGHSPSARNMPRDGSFANVWPGMAGETRRWDAQVPVIGVGRFTLSVVDCQYGGVAWERGE